MKKNLRLLLVSLAILGCSCPLAAQIQPHVSPPSRDLTPPSSSPQADAKPPQSPAATPESLAKGKAIVLAAAKAAGGELLNDVRSVVVTSSGQADTPGGSMDITLKLTIVYPNMLRSEAHLPVADVTQGFDGSAPWAVMPQGTVDLPPEYIGEDQRGIALAGGWGLYKQALAGTVEAQYLDDEDLEGKKTQVVQWSVSNGLVKLYFDPQTHFLVAAHFRSLTIQGPVEVDQRWSDFRTVSGLQYPHHSLILHGGNKFSETTIQDVKVNTNPDHAMFAKPAESPAN